MKYEDICGIGTPTVGGLLDYAAERYGSSPCIRWLDADDIRTKSYTELREDSLSAARVIYSLTGGKRRHIAITGKTSYTFLNFLNGIFLCGSVAVPFADGTPREEAAGLLAQADCEAVICDQSTVRNAEDAVRDTGKQLTVINVDDLPFTDALINLPEPDPEECALIMFTSGTTGKKKGVMLSSKALISNVFFKEMSFEGGHVALNVLPMHHIFCFSCDYLKNLKDGVTICLAGDPSQLYKSFLTFEPTVVRLVPMMTEGLLKKIRIMKKRDPELTPREAGERVFGRRLQSIISSGARLDPEKAAQFEEMGVTVRQGYGMTETGPRIAVPDGRTDAASAGAIISICEARIRDGELQIKSPSLMTGYYKDPEETEKVFTHDGWFRTGDTAVITEDRILYITGRVKNLIILSNGENVSPEEIEKRLLASPLVREVMVYAEKDRILAELYPDPDSESPVTEEQLRHVIEEYNAGAASEKEIARFTVRNTPFEKTSSGKIIRKKIIFNGGTEQ